MSSRINRMPISRAACGVIALVVLGAVGASRTAAQTAPEFIDLPGKVRDFRRAHPDFDVPESIGYGHVAGNVEFSLADSGKPGLIAAGYRVMSQWRDQTGNPIAPHLFSWYLARQVHLVTDPTITNNPTLDTYDSDIGAYGGSNVGPSPIFISGQDMPTIEEPTGLPALESLVSYVGAGSSTLDRDVHCNQFEMRNQHTLHIRGDVTMLCEGTFTIDQHCDIVIRSGSSLTLYLKGSFKLSNYVKVNFDSGDASRMTIYNLGTQPMKIGQNVQMYAQIISPEAPLYIANNGDFYGTYEGDSIVVDNAGGFHLAAPPLRDACERVLDDSEGSPGVSSTVGISSAATFAQWFSDDLGTNLSIMHVIRLLRNSDGVYEYNSPAFYPIDDELFGNEDEAHNYNFTFEAGFRFVYRACTDQFFELTGADDIYLFLDDDMVIDLGGIESGQRQIIELDRLSLTDGEEYDGVLFYAHRHGGDAAFGIRTNVELITPEITQVTSAGFD